MALRSIIQQLDADLTGEAVNPALTADHVCGPDSPIRPSSLVRRFLGHNESPTTRYSRVGFERRNAEKRLVEDIMTGTNGAGVPASPSRRKQMPRRDADELIAMHASAPPRAHVHRPVNDAKGPLKSQYIKL